MGILNTIWAFFATYILQKPPYMYRPPKVRPKILTIGGRYFYG